MKLNAAARPSWNEGWAHIGSEDMLAAKALIELSGDLASDAVVWLGYQQFPVYASEAWDAERIGTRRGDPIFLYEEWIADVDAAGRGWCSSADRLFHIVAALLDPERTLNLRATLGYGVGSLETDVWRILTEWGTGGNNRDRAGRLSVVHR
ncbi:hypothetical protein [Nocardioides psychrotolerans]|uniref:hypothetical protein n=1 Tax=Nocardioides psychrotolerans TaxID=1005945 RepID=UPI0031381C0D